jgi:hypothetical protein
MEYFSSLPKMLYSFDLVNQSPKVVSNIFSRFTIKQEVLNQITAFYKYQLQYGDTPEIVAYKQYNNPTLHWVICFINGMTDPQFDFPLLTDALERKIIKDYGYTTIDQAYAAIHHYELEVENTLAEVYGATTVSTEKHIVTLQQYSYASNTLNTNIINTPSTTTTTFRANNSNANSAVTSTLSVKSTYKPVYVYDYEDSLNESKREIKLLKPQYVEAMSNELLTVLNG